MGRRAVRTCRLVTLGCKVNQYETQQIKEALLNEQLDTLRQDASLGSVERAKAVRYLTGISLCCKHSLKLIQMLTADAKFGGSGIESRRGYLTTLC